MILHAFRRFSGCLLLICVACAPVPSQAAAERPRLVVLCCVDQLADWVFDSGAPHLSPDGGFARLQQQGVRFLDCAYQHACTETGPGHATIGTGAPAAVHGIVRNVWWSPPDGSTVYCVGHPAAALPGMTEAANRGPDRLLVETLSQRMRATLPGTKTASVSWKDRSAILMVGRHADVAAWFENSTGNLVTNKTWCAEVPAWIAKFNTDRAIDSFHGVEWTKVGAASAYEGLVDDRPYELVHQNGNNAHTLPQPMTGARPEPFVGYYTQIYGSPFGNETVRLAAQAAIDGMQLGADAVPDLLAVSFSATDVIGHIFGPDSVESRDALLRLDLQLAEFFAFLDDRVGRERYALFLTADHGVGPTPEWARAQGLDAGRGLIQSQARAVAEKSIHDRFGAAATGTRYCSHVGEWALVLDQRAFDRGDGAAAAARRLDEACDIAAAAVPIVRGLSAAYSTREILGTDRHDDPIKEALRLALHPARAGSVQLVVEPNWLDGITPASHGTPHPYDRQVVGFAIGAGIARGIAITDAVTPGLGVVMFSRLLGIEPPAHAVDAVPRQLFVGR